jgi:putative FmdB family regulatory protein
MPIYEYKCNNCHEKFEVFVFSHADTIITCSECGSDNTERVLSSFASSGNSGGSSCRPSSGFR